MGEGSLDDQLRGEMRWSSFTDAGDMSNSSSSLSTEERHSNAPGSEPEGDEGGLRRPGMNKEKNREAARKSRKKQTEKADQLHQELESLEASNSALRKEISSLEKTALFYAAILERHEPLCHPRTPPSVSCSPSAQASASTSAATPSGSFAERSPLTPASTASSSELFSSSNSKSFPHSSVMTAPVPHSLFHYPGWDLPHPPPPTPCPGSVPHTPSDAVGEIPITLKPGPSHHSTASPGLLLSMLTVPSPPRAPQTSAGASEGCLAQQSLLDNTSRDLGFLELLEVNDWILQGPEMDPDFSEQ